MDNSGAKVFKNLFPNTLFSSRLASNEFYKLQLDTIKQRLIESRKFCWWSNPISSVKYDRLYYPEVACNERSRLIHILGFLTVTYSYNAKSSNYNVEAEQTHITPMNNVNTTADNSNNDVVFEIFIEGVNYKLKCAIPDEVLKSYCKSNFLINQQVALLKGQLDHAVNLFNVVDIIDLIVPTIRKNQTITRTKSLSSAITKNNTHVLILNNCFIDDLARTHEIANIFLKLEEHNPMVIILLGPFLSNTEQSSYKLFAEKFNTFWQTLNQISPQVCCCSQLILISSKQDPVLNSNPTPALNSVLINNLDKSCPNVHLTGSPLKLQISNKLLVVSSNSCVMELMSRQNSVCNYECECNFSAYCSWLHGQRLLAPANKDTCNLYHPYLIEKQEISVFVFREKVFSHKQKEIGSTTYYNLKNYIELKSADLQITSYK